MTPQPHHVRLIPLFFLIQTGLMLLTVGIMLYVPGTLLGLPLGDIVHYFTKVTAVLQGQIAFPHLALEYPILVFPIIALPGLLTTQANVYMVWFVMEVIIWNAWLYWLVVRWVRKTGSVSQAIQSAGWYTVWMIMLTPLWGLRLDVPTSTMLFLGVTLMSNRPTWAAAVGVVGGYVKLVPLVVTLAVLWAERNWRMTLKALGVLVAIGSAWVVIAWPSLHYAVQYHADRGLEIGSLYAGVLFGVGKIFHLASTTVYQYSSLEFVSAIAPTVARIAPFVQIVAILFPLLLCRGGTPERNLRLVLAMTLGYIVFGKVFSPQYILWLIPFYAVLSGRTARTEKILFTLVCLLTSLLYPWNFSQLAVQFPLAFVLLNIRNGLLVGLYWQAVRAGRDPLVVEEKRPSLG